MAVVHRYCYLLNDVITMFVVENILSSQFAWVSVYSSSNLSLKHAYINFPKLSILRCVFRYVQIRAIIQSVQLKSGPLTKP